MNCPKGHEVGFKIGDRLCTARCCAEDPPPFLAAQKTKEQLLAEAKTATKAPKPNKEDELIPGHAAYLQRIKTAGVPAGLVGDKAVEWSQAKLLEMLPEAVANIQHDLRYGSAKERTEAAMTVLKANGVAQKDAVNATTPTIILQLGDSLNDVPFLQRIQAVQKKKDDK